MFDIFKRRNDKARSDHAPEREFGVNLVGYIRSEHGVGQACRHTAEALEKSGIAWSAYDWEVNNLSRKEDFSWDARISKRFPYRYTIFNINADQMPVAKEKLPKEAWDGYNIGVWYWELPEFPDEWLGVLKYVREIWAPTRFIADSIAMKANIPVIYMPPPIEMQPSANVTREFFGLPEKRFLFLTMFDSLSIQARKNPMAAINAFKKAFGPDDKAVGLVVKVGNAKFHAEEVAQLEKIRGDYGNIYFIKGTFSRKEVNSLLELSDAVLSLHRSEGLGLLCQEAMCLGKPVVATNWSGNVDFMNNDCACMVDYELRPIGVDFGPYKANQVWAEADVDQAAGFMRRLYSDEGYRRSISARAVDMMRRYSPEICGARMLKRLEFLESVRIKASGPLEIYPGGPEFADGFCQVEGKSVWTSGPKCEFRFDLPEKYEGVDLELAMTCWPLVDGKTILSQRAIVYVDGVNTSEMAISAPGEYRIAVPGSLVKSQSLSVEIAFPNATTPKSLGINEDNRTLALNISKVVLRDAK